ncbi:hypothetical protein QYE76_018758 [Lolium multiflorum]|uniref:Uncharacterized protein n=1 Tax=Lolium multiflorum TaxID=4521 RepID=A0AAD8PSA9_LOLMU|nr:hypothetical protein QYE76_018758 [Lolium multiflorum]
MGNGGLGEASGAGTNFCDSDGRTVMHLPPWVQSGDLLARRKEADTPRANCTDDSARSRPHVQSSMEGLADKGRKMGRGIWLHGWGRSSGGSVGAGPPGLRSSLLANARGKQDAFFSPYSCEIHCP